MGTDNEMNYGMMMIVWNETLLSIVDECAKEALLWTRQYINSGSCVPCYQQWELFKNESLLSVLNCVKTMNCNH